MLLLRALSWQCLSVLSLFLTGGVHVAVRVMYTVNESGTVALQGKLCVEMVCNVHGLPAKGSACHPPASSLFCVFRGFRLSWSFCGALQVLFASAGEEM